MTSTYPIIYLDLGLETLEFSGSQVASANLICEIDPISAELPISTIELTIITQDDSFSMFSGSTYQHLSQRLPMLVYEQLDLVTDFLGKFYLDDWENISEREFRFTAIDIIGVLEKTTFEGIFWSSPITLRNAISQVLDSINVAYEIDAEIEDFELSGWIPPGNCREALKQICFAAGATATSSRSMGVRILKVVLPNKIPTRQVLNSERIDNQQPVKLRPLVTGIELVSHNYAQGDVLETIYEEFLEAGLHKIVFGSPYYNIIVDGPGFDPVVLGFDDGDTFEFEDGDTLEISGEYTFGPNSITLNMTESGTITITGYPWVDSKRSFLFSETGVSEFDNRNDLVIKEATLVSVNNAQSVLDLVRDYYRQRYTQNIKLVPTDVKIRDIMLINTLYEKRLLATAQKMSIDLAGGYLNNIDIFGIEPIYAVPVEHPVRRPKTGVAVAGAELTRQNMFREYA